MNTLKKIVDFIGKVASSSLALATENERVLER